jgi:hypothetical protein
LHVFNGFGVFFIQGFDVFGCHPLSGDKLHQLGYFIAYDNLFSTWIDPTSEFNESNVRDALSAFSRLISPTYKKLFDGIFTTLENSLNSDVGSIHVENRLS